MLPTWKPSFIDSYKNRSTVTAQLQSKSRLITFRGKKTLLLAKCTNKLHKCYTSVLFVKLRRSHCLLHATLNDSVECWHCATSHLYWISSTLFCRSGWAPAANSLSTIERWPSEDAEMRAVWPVWEESEGQLMMNYGIVNSLGWLVLWVRTYYHFIALTILLLWQP